MTAGPERDLVGYGAQPPRVAWPGGAKLAISLVVNYEEGSERSFALGDPDQESLTEWGSYPFPPDVRNLAMESMYEYGSRVGVWRILDVLRRYGVNSTFFACAVALEKAPAVAQAAVAAGHEICSHGYRWEEVFRLSREEERRHIELAIRSIEKTTGSRPVGWYCRYGPSVNTRELLVEEGGFLYDSDAYNDDVPYYTKVSGKEHLVVPYTADVNDIQQWLADPLASTDDFFHYLRDSFDVLYREAQTHPKMMSVGLHCRIIGRPGRIGGLEKFIEYAQTFPDVWFATRADIARAWKARGSSTDPMGIAPNTTAPAPTIVDVEGVEPTRFDAGAWSKIFMSSSVVDGCQTTAGYAVFPKGTSSDAIAHEVEEWMFVLQGSGFLHTDAGRQPLARNTAVHIPSRMWHRIENDDGVEDLVSIFGFPSAEYPQTLRREDAP